jgi:hypothetical protein
MLLRAYPILGTLILALAFASPALAKGKKKSDDSAQSDDASAKKSDKKAEASAKKSKKKGKKAEEEAEEKSDDKKDDKAAEGASGATGETAASADAEPMPDPNVWEKPPEEAEKPIPKAEAVAPEDKPVGDGRPWSVGIAAGWAFKTDRRGFPADPYGLAAGLRGGYAALLDNKLYLGLYFNWYLGGSQTGSAARANLSDSTSHANYWQFGAEVGYDWWVASVIIRPSMQIGEAISVNDALGTTKATGDFMFGPGLTVVYPWDNMFIGGEMRGNIVTGDGISALLFAAQLGMRFEP